MSVLSENDLTEIANHWYRKIGHSENDLYEAAAHAEQATIDAVVKIIEAYDFNESHFKECDSCDGGVSACETVLSELANKLKDK